MKLNDISPWLRLPDNPATAPSDGRATSPSALPSSLCSRMLCTASLRYVSTRRSPRMPAPSSVSFVCGTSTCHCFSASVMSSDATKPRGAPLLVRKWNFVPSLPRKS